MVVGAGTGWWGGGGRKVRMLVCRWWLVGGRGRVGYVYMKSERGRGERLRGGGREKEEGWGGLLMYTRRGGTAAGSTANGYKIYTQGRGSIMR